MQSLPIAIAATIFMTVLSVILLFPDTQNPSGGTMNYTVAILGAFHSQLEAWSLSKAWGVNTMILIGAVLILSILDFSYGKHNGVPNYFK